MTDSLALSDSGQKVPKSELLEIIMVVLFIGQMTLLSPNQHRMLVGRQKGHLAYKKYHHNNFQKFAFRHWPNLE